MGGQEEELDVCSLILDAAKATETFSIYQAHLYLVRLDMKHNLCMVRWGVCMVGGGTTCV